MRGGVGGAALLALVLLYTLASVTRTKSVTVGNGVRNVGGKQLCLLTHSNRRRASALNCYSFGQKGFALATITRRPIITRLIISNFTNNFALFTRPKIACRTCLDRNSGCCVHNKRLGSDCATRVGRSTTVHGTVSNVRDHCSSLHATHGFHDTDRIGSSLRHRRGTLERLAGAFLNDGSGLVTTCAVCSGLLVHRTDLHRAHDVCTALNRNTGNDRCKHVVGRHVGHLRGARNNTRTPSFALASPRNGTIAVDDIGNGVGVVSF